MNRFVRVESHPWRRGRRFRIGRKRFVVATYAEARAIALAHGFRGIKIASEPVTAKLILPLCKADRV